MESEKGHEGRTSTNRTLTTLHHNLHHLPHRERSPPTPRARCRTGAGAGAGAGSVTVTVTVAETDARAGGTTC